MKHALMLRTLSALLLCLLLLGGVSAAAGKNDCLTEEELLRSNEADACSGLSYLFNPSACAAARKARSAFDADRCRQSGENRQNEPPEKPPATTESAAAPARSGTKDGCLTELELLRSNEADSCSGLSNLFHPSGCISARKAYRAFDPGKCSQPAEQQRTEPPIGNVPAAADPVPAEVLPVREKPAPQAPAEPSAAETETDRLRREIDLLKGEVRHLRDELMTIKSQQR